MYNYLRAYSTIKQAGAGLDALQSGLGSLLARRQVSDKKGMDNYLSTQSSIGSSEGFRSDLTLDDIAKLDRVNLGMLPGMTAFKNSSKQQALENMLSTKARKTKSKSEHYGQTTSAALLSLLGSLTGGITNPLKGSKGKDGKSSGRAESAALGGTVGLAGGGAANLIGILAALLTKGRSKEDQKKYYEKSNWANWVVPGVASYNKTKTLGLADRLIKEIAKSKK